MMMTSEIQFPYNDNQTKLIALLGYTGVGKTSFITAAYFENIICGKDAFTQRFFQRIEEEIQRYGQIPLTMGDASTLSFIETQSRNEFTIQDFSGEHIKLERNKERHYQELLTRADNAHALICMLSAASFYRTTRIHEEVDAIQTFVNELRSLGARIPVVVVLTKCDTVPRFYLNFPILKTICALLSSLPLLRLPASRGLELTRRRFPSIFAGLDFKGKGPQTVFQSIALPRLESLRAWHWPKGLGWLGHLLRRFWVDPKFLFHKNFSLTEPFRFCFQAFQISMLRNLLVKHHADPEYCQTLISQCSQELIDAGTLGSQFYFKEYFDRILQDTRSLIDEMQEEVGQLTQNATRLLTHEKDLAQNLELWLETAADKIRKFNKPWSEGARKTLESLRHTTLTQLRDRMGERITTTLAETGTNTFYRLIEILRLRRDMARLAIWANEAIVLPEVESFQQRLLEHFIALVLSRPEIASALFQEDRARYLEVLTIVPPQEIKILEQLVEAAATLQNHLAQHQVGSGDWHSRILEPFRKLENFWLELSRTFNLSHACLLRTTFEKKILASLEQEAGHFKSLSQILDWAAQTEQLLHCDGSSQQLLQVVEIAARQADLLLQKEVQELSARAQKWQGTGKQLPARLREWFDESEKRRAFVKAVAGTKGVDSLEKLQKTVFTEARDYLSNSLKQTLEDSRKKVQASQGDRGALVQIVEILHVNAEVEMSDIFSRYGLALPPTQELEQSLFHNLALLTVGRSGLTASVYGEDRALFLGALRGSPHPYLKSLDLLVNGFDALKRGDKEIAAVPIAEWEHKILTPMRTFHQSWLELASQFELPKMAATRVEAERVSVRSLQDHRGKLTLRQLRDWVGTLYSLLQLPEHRDTLDGLLRGTESEIRGQFQGDLEKFMGRCVELESAVAQLSPKQTLEIQTTWEKFAGSVQALAYSSDKFPHTELSLDARIQNILEREGPEQVQKTVEVWFGFLQKHRRLSRFYTDELSAAIAKVRTIFHRPESFLSISKKLTERLAHFAQRRRLARYLGCAGIGLVLVILGLGIVRWRQGVKVQGLLAFEQQNFGQHQELIQRWQGFSAYPAWLMPVTGEFLIAKMNLHHQLQQLDDLCLRLREKKPLATDLPRLQQQLEQILLTQPALEVRRKVHDAWIGMRSLELLGDLENSAKPKIWWQGEVAGIKTLTNELLKDKPFFATQPLWDELWLAYQKKYPTIDNEK